MASQEYNESKPIKVTWSILWVVLGAFFLVGGWAASMELRIQEHTEKLSVMESIDKRLYRIEIKMGIEEK